MRYVTLTHFYNACASDADMVRYRQGVVKLLNSLSRNPEVLKMRTVDPEKTIIAFNLADLDWSSEDWARLAGLYPYGMAPGVPAYDTAVSITGTKLPWVRGDWLAFTASRPPLYSDLLKLPETFAELERLEGGETIFSLPNGFQGYYLNTDDGERLVKGPTEIVLDDSQRDRAVTNAISCFGCHNQGIRQATDDIRAYVLGDSSFPEEVRKKVSALYV